MKISLEKIRFLIRKNILQPDELEKLNALTEFICNFEKHVKRNDFIIVVRAISFLGFFFFLMFCCHAGSVLYFARFFSAFDFRVILCFTFISWILDDYSIMIPALFHFILFFKYVYPILGTYRYIVHFYEIQKNQ